MIGLTADGTFFPSERYQSMCGLTGESICQTLIFSLYIMIGSIIFFQEKLPPQNSTVIEIAVSKHSVICINMKD
jgi:hypothetical protein